MESRLEEFAYVAISTLSVELNFDTLGVNMVFKMAHYIKSFKIRPMADALALSTRKTAFMTFPRDKW